VPIVGLPSLSVLGSKSFSSLKALLMSPSAVLRAARHGSQSATEIAVMGPGARCFPQHALSVAKALRYLLNLAVISRCIAVIATEKSDRVDNAVLTLECVVSHVVGSFNT
jgi:hypothetical protein